MGLDGGSIHGTVWHDFICQGRMEGDLISRQDCVNQVKISLECYLQSSKEELLKAVRWEGNENREAAASFKARRRTKNIQERREKLLYRQFARQGEEQRSEETWNWLKEGNLKRETEALNRSCTRSSNEPLPGSHFFLRVRSRPISARKWNVAGKYLERFSEIPRLKLRAGEGFCKYLLCQKTRVGDGGELERSLDDAIGTGSTLWSCCKKRFEKKLCRRR